ncbi:MAG TPA: ComEC/Rec2 family competence protein [Pirellulales bacterium]|nr:ComEC/Rec2 family competence protein [Pirellulales bacterium]
MSLSLAPPVHIRKRIALPHTAAFFGLQAAPSSRRRPAPYQPLVLVLGAACAGIMTDRWLGVTAAIVFGLWWILGVTSLTAWWRWRHHNRQVAAMAALSISVLAAAAAWHHARWNLFAADELGLAATETPQPVCVEAVAASAPQTVPAPQFDPLRSIPAGLQMRWLVDVVQVRKGAQWQAASGRAQVSLEGELHNVQAGDRLRIFGELEAPLPAGNPGEFDSALYERSRRELCIIRVKKPECVATLQQGSLWNPARWISAGRRFGDQLLWGYLSREKAGLAAAVLLGQREQVDQETNEAFLETGTIHILCIAGLHVGILAWLLFAVFSTGWLSRRTALLCVMMITGAYMLVTMAEPPVMRATLLVWIVCLGTWLGRARIGLNSLALAGIVVLVFNPAGLFHTGVQLSFLSVAVLMCAGQRMFGARREDPLDRLIADTRPWPQRAWRLSGQRAWQIFVLGAVLWLAITPLVMARFHLIAPSGLILNVLLTPVVMVAMLAGLGVLFFGAWLPPLASVFAWVCNGSLSVLESTVKWFAHLPGGRFWVAGPGDWWLVLFYLGVAAVVLLPHKLPPLRWRAAFAAGLCGVGLIGALPAQANQHTLRCDFIAVGHGGGELLELPDGKTLLFDAGRMGAPLGGARSISAFLWSRGITHLDAVVLSHADTDHYNSLPELLQRFSVGVVYVSPVMFREKSKALRTLKDSIEQSGTPLQYAFAGDRLKLDEGVTIDVLHPPPLGVVGSDNANCLVLSIGYDGRRILFTGDLAPPGMDLVMNGDPVPCDVLQAPHHGSAYSEPEYFADWTAPKWAIICGSNLDGRIARPIYEAHGATVLNTAEVGAVTVTVGNGQLGVQTFRQPKPAHGSGL